VPPDQYAEAAQEALGRLSPEERPEFLKMLQERAAARGVKLPGKVASDPKDLGEVLTDLQARTAPRYSSFVYAKLGPRTARCRRASPAT
jgi:hypothetical protein